MLDEDHSPENALVAAALEHPRSFYIEWAERPEVAHALSMFKSELEIRKTCRLDLVTWVQYICAFGYDGPSDEAWALLFSTCRVLPMLEPNPSQLAEHEIAVLLAYSKIKPDHCDSMTPAQLVKHRIKPAVLGRSVARTPGILQHIHAKFETWAFGPFTEVFCNHCISICDSGVLLPAIERLPPHLADVGEFIRENANVHSQSLLKNWRGIITSVLGIKDGDVSSPRAQRFEEIFKEKRMFMYQTLFIKLSEHYFKTTQSTARVIDSSSAIAGPVGIPGERAEMPSTPKTQMRTAVKRLLCATSSVMESEPLTGVQMPEAFELQKVEMFTQAGTDPLQSVEIDVGLNETMGLGQSGSSRELDVLTLSSPQLTGVVGAARPAKRARHNP